MNLDQNSQDDREEYEQSGRAQESDHEESQHHEGVGSEESDENDAHHDGAEKINDESEEHQAHDDEAEKVNEESIAQPDSATSESDTFPAQQEHEPEGERAEKQQIEGNDDEKAGPPDAERDGSQPAEDPQQSPQSSSEPGEATLTWAAQRPRVRFPTRDLAPMPETLSSVEQLSPEQEAELRRLGVAFPAGSERQRSFEATDMLAMAERVRERRGRRRPQTDAGENGGNAERGRPAQPTWTGESAGAWSAQPAPGQQPTQNFSLPPLPPPGPELARRSMFVRPDEDVISGLHGALLRALLRANASEYANPTAHGHHRGRMLRAAVLARPLGAFMEAIRRSGAYPGAAELERELLALEVFSRVLSLEEVAGMIHAALAEQMDPSDFVLLSDGRFGGNDDGSSSEGGAQASDDEVV